MITWNQNTDKKQDYVTWIYSFSVYIQADDVYIDIAEDVETRFGTSNYEFERQLPRGIN